MKLYFVTSNIFIQDGNYDDLKVDDTFEDNLTIGISKNFEKIKSKTTTSFSHIEDNIYDITCYVYKGETDGNIFIEVAGLNFTIDENEKYNLKTDSYYKFRAYIYHDIWNNLVLGDSSLIDKYYEELKIKGTIKSIFYDTSKMILTKDNHWTNAEVKSKFDFKIDRTTNNGWGEEDKFPHTSGYYLIEFEINNKEE